jgi:hypothetical protein
MTKTPSWEWSQCDGASLLDTQHKIMQKLVNLFLEPHTCVVLGCVPASWDWRQASLMATKQ